MARFFSLNLMQVFWMCLMVVGVLFVGYEVAEAVWLRQANQELRHVLHLVLAFATSAVAATVATYVLLCQFDECGVDAPRVVLPPSLAHRVQKVSLRTKLIVPMVALAVIPGVGIGLFALARVRAIVASGAVRPAAETSELTVFLVVAMALVLSVAALTGGLIAHYVTRPVGVLRDVAQSIAGGDLTRRVELQTGDELEHLAADFNTMTVRLEHAQGRLAAWNADLQREVEHQTSELRRLQAGLARVERLSCVGQLTASILHEIGNPLAAIKTTIQVAEERDGSSPVLSSVLREVDRLGGVLRTYSRLNRLQATPYSAVDLGEVVRGVAVLIEPELRRKGVTLDLTVPASVPAVRGDADQLRQLLINFVLNAAEALPGGGTIGVALRRSAADPNAGVVIEVADSGVGIPEAAYPHIWDPFFTTKPDGTGLGLAISKRIVEEHGGTVSVESRVEQGGVGGGTTVRVELPAAGARAS